MKHKRVGRPRRATERSIAVVKACLTEDERVQLAAYCARYGVTVSAAILRGLVALEAI